MPPSEVIKRRAVNYFETWLDHHTLNDLGQIGFGVGTVAGIYQVSAPINGHGSGRNDYSVEAGGCTWDQYLIEFAGSDWSVCDLLCNELRDLLWILDLVRLPEIVELFVHLRPELPLVNKAGRGICAALVCCEKIVALELLSGRYVGRSETEQRDHPIKLDRITARKSSYLKLSAN